LKPAFCNLDISHVIACHLQSTSELYTASKLSHVDFSFSQSGSFHKASNIEQKAKFGQKKLALNKTNKSLA